MRSASRRPAQAGRLCYPPGSGCVDFGEGFAKNRGTEMTFLPIVERELRVAARKPGTYWTCVGVGLAAMIIGGVAALVAQYNPPMRFGTVFLQSLSGLAMVYCLGAGRFLTADCLSGEKREETMGLLFLTDLKGYDVVLGKMAATSLNGLYGLLAVLPVLAITLVTGGTTSGEFCRVALVLLDTFLFSLAIGIFASALTREFHSAMALNFYVLLALAGFLPALAGLLQFWYPSSPLAEGLFRPCPVYALVLAFDAHYKLEAARFWSSAAFILAMSWLLVALACKIAPRSWQAGPSGPGNNAPRKHYAFAPLALAFRAQLLDENAYYWLAARPWWKARTVWPLIGMAMLWVVSMIFSVGWLDEATCLFWAFILNGAFKFWITLEAGQCLAADVKSGAFELLLSTPLDGRDILRGQILALRRQFLKPLLAVAAIEVFFMVKLMAGTPRDRSFFFWLWMAGILMLAADVVTLSVVAMAAALTEKNITRASLKTVRQVLALPWALWAGVAVFERTWYYLFPEGAGPGWKFDLACWFAIGMGVDFLFGSKAWRRLTGNFRELAVQRFAPAPPPPRLRARCARMVRAARDLLWRHPRNRRWAAGLATVLVIGLALAFWESNRPHDPPPEMVLTGPGNGATLQAMPAGRGVLLILPDGSLWRWGQTDGAYRAVLPEQVGTNRDWKMVSVSGKQRLGVRRNGTLWEWQAGGAPTQVGADTDWAEAVSDVSHSYKVARKKDGTLWEWGDVGMSNAPPSSPPVWIPAPPKTHHAWKATDTQGWTSLLPVGRVLSAGTYTLAVDSDGALWVWGAVRLRSGGGTGGPVIWGTNFNYLTVQQMLRGGTGSPSIWVTNYSDPIQVCRETNWAGFASGGVQNQQGDIWNVFAVPPNPAQSINAVGTLGHSQIPVQVGTNRDWTMVEAWRNMMLAVRADGTLWSWGEYISSVGGTESGVRNSQPVQLCSETDWVGFDHSFGLPLARNKAGQLWFLSGLFNATPGAGTSISSIGSLLAFTSAANWPAQSFNSYRPGATRYEIHTNGALWLSPIVSLASAQGGTGLIREAQPAGPRADWIAVANARTAVFGLTADGTLWTWGANLGESPRVETRSRIEVARMRAAAALGMRSANQWTPDRATPTLPIQEKPRALMKLAPEKEK